MKAGLLIECVQSAGICDRLFDEIHRQSAHELSEMIHAPKQLLKNQESTNCFSQPSQVAKLGEILQQRTLMLSLLESVAITTKSSIN